MSSTGRITKEQLENLAIGMEEREVRSILGSPSQTIEPRDVVTPSEAFESLGSEFRFPDQDLDTVWVYLHGTSNRRVFYLGFREGRLVTMWKATKSE